MTAGMDLCLQLWEARRELIEARKQIEAMQAENARLRAAHTGAGAELVAA